MEDLIMFCEEKQIAEWIDSDVKKATRTLLIPDCKTFDFAYKLSSVRMFYSIIQIISEVQRKFIVPVITKDRLDFILQAIMAQTPDDDQQKYIDLRNDYILSPLTLKTMSLALERLPIEVLPEGLVQINIIGNIKEKRIAQEATRKSMIASLDRDYADALLRLQNMISQLENPDVDIYVPIPKNNNRFGFIM